jgi:DNA-binding NtrC family response regulator
MGAHNCSVLIIDDDSLHLTIYRWMLEREGYSCKTALVSETLDLPANDAIDLVLLDYRLNSSLTAVHVAERVKKAFHHVPIIVLSELQWMPDDIRPYAAGFVHKGEPKRMLDTIADVLQKRAVRAS